MKLNKMAQHYLVTALWSTCGYGDQAQPLDADFDISDISEEFQAEAQADCEALLSLVEHLITEDENDLETIGHDFWLTRNHHGAGFWDGDYVNGKQITEILQKHFKENDDALRESIEKLNEEESA